MRGWAAFMAPSVLNRLQGLVCVAVPAPPSLAVPYLQVMM